MGGQGNFLLSSHFFREYWFNHQAWCQPISNQIVLMPKSRQMACEKRLAGMEKNSRKFSLVWKGSVLIQKLCSRREAQAALGEEDRSEALPSTLPNALGCHGRAAPQYRGPKCGIISLVLHTKGAKGRPFCHLSNSGNVDLT